MELGNEIYRYKDSFYLKLDEIQVKNPVTREWDVHVLYQNKDGHVFSRDITEFYERFKLMPTLPKFTPSMFQRIRNA